MSASKAEAKAAGQAVRHVAEKSSRPPFASVMRVGAAVVGLLLLVASVAVWCWPPDVQVAEATIDGTEQVLSKKTEVTENGKTTVTSEPSVAATGRSETLSIALLLIGGVTLFAAALPDRNLTLKAAGAEAAISGTVAAAASKEAEQKAKEEGADDAKVSTVGAVAAQQAAIMLPTNLDRALPGVLDRTLAAVSGSRLGAAPDAELAGRAAEETVDQASAAALAHVLDA
jgi:hypothetical protein